MNKLCFRPRPLKIVLRLSSTGSHPNFRLPYQGWWAVTGIGGGGGSGATHISYADYSERGSNGSVANFIYTYRKTVGMPEVGVGGLGGTLTNNSDIPAQRGKVGGETDTGVSPRNGGSGGKCAFEEVGLNATQPAPNYPSTSYDSRAVSGVFLCGCQHNGGGVSSSAGQGAAGRTSPAQAGLNGTNGRVDFYCKG